MQFSRIQFTPDLMPADVTGTNIIAESPTGQREFSFQRGPVFTNILLADEVNRATPKTQSALLEAMQEKSVTVAGKTYQLEEPYIVLATQNPLEMEGTYPLPEAQLDRFLFKLKVFFPTFEEMVEIMARTTQSRTPDVRQVLAREDILMLRGLVREVPIAPHVQEHAVKARAGHASRVRVRDRERQEVRALRGVAAWCAGANAVRQSARPFAEPLPRLD
jgi:MoxR-like ATPase